MSSVAAAIGIICGAWFLGLLATALLLPQVPDSFLAAIEAVFAMAGAFVAARIAAALGTKPMIVGTFAAVAVLALGTFPPVAGPLVPFVSLRWIVATAVGLVLGTPLLGLRTQSNVIARPRRVALTAIVALAVLGDSTVPAGAWIASARRKHPTATMRRTGGVDLVIDTHQWFANRGLEILRSDGRNALVDFLDSVDLTTPAEPSRPGMKQSYRWQILMGASDADGSLYTHIPDHFFNWWTPDCRRSTFQRWLHRYVLRGRQRPMKKTITAALAALGLIVSSADSGSQPGAELIPSRSPATVLIGAVGWLASHVTEAHGEGLEPTTLIIAMAGLAALLVGSVAEAHRGRRSALRRAL